VSFVGVRISSSGHWGIAWGALFRRLGLSPFCP
jgi:hypothetical protein